MTNSRLLVLLCAASASALASVAFAEDAGQASKAPSVADVVVTAPRQEVKARILQQLAPNLIAVQSAETIAKYPDFSAAEALARLPGISMLEDTGEGRFVNIRGIDGNLDGATFGGVPLLNTNPGGTYNGSGGRAVEFDTVPTGSIDGIVVTYTGLPDHDAEGLGGSVELTPRTASNITKPFIEGAAGWGYEPAHKHTGPLNLDLAVGARFGFSNGHLTVQGEDTDVAPRVGFFSNPTPFSFVLTASMRSDRRGFDDLEEDYNNPAVDRSYQDIQFRRYDYHRDRFGYGGEFDFKPNEDHSYYVRANIAGYVESVKKKHLVFNLDTSTAVGSGFTAPASIQAKSTDERETHRNQVYVVGGFDRFGEATLDYRASLSEATFTVDKNYGATFNGPSGTATYNNSGDNGDFPIFNFTGANPNDASLYTLKGNKIGNSETFDTDREFAYAANLQFPVHLINDEDRMKVGFQIRNRDKKASDYTQSYVLPGAALNLSTVSNSVTTDYYEGHYTNGPDISTVALRSLATPATLSSAAFDQGGYFAAREDIYAGYGQYTATIGKWGLLAGVRVEATDAKYSAYSDDNSTATLALVSRTENYTNAFPTVQVRYDFTPKFLVRATYSTGIGRPGFNQNTAAVSSNHDSTDPQISAGNPNLKPTTGDNFDVSFEYYLPRGGIAQFGFFDKEFKNYIVTRVLRNVPYTGTDPTFTGLNVTYTTFANVSSAYARGVDANYHQQFLWLPKPFDGLGLEGNIAYVDSRLQEYDAATSAANGGPAANQFGPMPGTSRFTGNLAGFYEANGVEARISAQYIGNQLYQYGGSKAADQHEDTRVTVDFAGSYHFTPNLTAYFNAKNLTNAPLRIYVYNSSFPIQREFYDATYEAGVKVKF